MRRSSSCVKPIASEGVGKAPSFLSLCRNLMQYGHNDVSAVKSLEDLPKS
jgi:hypothetical protein